MKELTCIICPNGCELSVDDEGRVSGNLCSRGSEFAIQELTDPQRVVTSTIRTTVEGCPVVSCRTDGTVPKDRMFDIMAEINRVVITDRLKAGTAVISNAAGTGVNVITTRDM